MAWISSGANKTLDDDDDDGGGKKQETGSRFVFHYASPAQPHAALVLTLPPPHLLVCLSTRYGGRFTGLSDCVHQHSVVKAAALG